jgi:hypothetical protein
MTKSQVSQEYFVEERGQNWVPKSNFIVALIELQAEGSLKEREWRSAGPGLRTTCDRIERRPATVLPLKAAKQFGQPTQVHVAGGVEKTLCTRPAASIRSALIRAQSRHCRAARSIHCDMTSDCSGLHPWRPYEFPSLKKIGAAPGRSRPWRRDPAARCRRKAAVRHWRYGRDKAPLPHQAPARRSRVPGTRMRLRNARRADLPPPRACRQFAYVPGDAPIGQPSASRKRRSPVPPRVR